MQYDTLLPPQHRSSKERRAQPDPHFSSPPTSRFSFTKTRYPSLKNACEWKSVYCRVLYVVWGVSWGASHMKLRIVI